ncbi:unnamed protein product [Arctia plantaginis]|uniref:Uncharacterized protein n=1 Tax=Arctia plantaginis TaxID=874455 RepID=A0A8S1B559_ARCPL|nr:unnamed protein product [Arctia plantaginis]
MARKKVAGERGAGTRDRGTAARAPVARRPPPAPRRLPHSNAPPSEFILPRPAAPSLCATRLCLHLDCYLSPYALRAICLSPRRKPCFAEVRGQHERRRTVDEGGVSQIARDAAGAALSRGHVPGAAARRL